MVRRSLVAPVFKHPLSGAAARVHSELKEGILTGRIPPGGVIHEIETAARFRVSKTPVRDALSLLRAEGLVQAVPHRGYIATEVSLRDFEISLRSFTFARSLKVTRQRSLRSTRHQNRWSTWRALSAAGRRPRR